MKIVWFLLPILIQKCSGTIEDDLKLILDHSDSDPSCIFNHTVVTSETIQNFPKCSKVYGILVINGNTDLSQTQIKTALKNMSSLVGGVRVENSTLTSLSFLTPGAKSKAFSLSCKNYGVYINNNPNLNDGNLLDKIEPFENEDFNDCDIEISGNPLLNLTDLCYSFFLSNLVNLKTGGNLVNCGCQGGEISASSLSQFQNCTELYNGLEFQNFTESTVDLSSLSKISYIRGNIDVQNSNLQNLSFLENFKFSLVYAKEGEAVLNLQNNPQMTRLGLPVLENMDNANWITPKLGNIEKLHPDFCLSLSDFWLFNGIQMTFQNLEAKLCDEFDEDIDLMCKFVSMEELDEGCKTIVGNVLIGSGDEEYTEKLSGANCLIGTLTIKNTKLENLMFLNRLAFIAALEDTPQPIIQIVGNQNLTNPKIGSSFGTIFGRRIENRNAIIQDNHPNIWNTTNGTCNLFGKTTNEIRDMYQRSLNYTGGDCGERVDAKSNAPLLQKIWTCFVALLVLSVR